MRRIAGAIALVLLINACGTPTQRDAEVELITNAAPGRAAAEPAEPPGAVLPRALVATSAAPSGSSLAPATSPPATSPPTIAPVTSAPTTVPPTTVPSTAPPTIAAPVPATVPPPTTGTTGPPLAPSLCVDLDDVIPADAALADIDGDGQLDAVSVTPLPGGRWFVDVRLASGVDAVAEISDSHEAVPGDVVLRATHQLDDDPELELLVQTSASAVGSSVAVFDLDGCRLRRVVRAEDGRPASFGIGGAVGFFERLSCDGSRGLAVATLSSDDGVRFTGLEFFYRLNRSVLEPTGSREIAANFADPSDPKTVPFDC